MSTKLFHSIYSYASKLGCDRPRKNFLEEIKNKIRKIDIFSAIYINIKVVTTKNSKIGLQRSLQNLMLDFSKKKSQIGQEFSSENDFEPRFSISLHCGAGLPPSGMIVSSNSSPSSSSCRIFCVPLLELSALSFAASFEDLFLSLIILF